MTKVNIKLSSIEDVRNFVNIVSKYDMDIDLMSGRYVVDAKSIMGIFSLDLMQPIALTAHCAAETEHCAECDALLEEIKPYII